MATLTVTIQEEISVNGRNVDATTVSTFSADEVIHTTTNIGTAEASIFLFDAANAAGTILDGALKYLRITNKASGANVHLRIGNAAEEYFVDVEEGGSFMLTADHVDANDNIAASGAATMSLAQIDYIKGKSASGTIQIEIFAAY
jgi:hypothetical protein